MCIKLAYITIYFGLCLQYIIYICDFFLLLVLFFCVRACGLALDIFYAKENLSIFTFQNSSGCFVQITAAYLSSLPPIFSLSTTDYLPPKPAKFPVS